MAATGFSRGLFPALAIMTSLAMANLAAPARAETTPPPTSPVVQSIVESSPAVTSTTHVGRSAKVLHRRRVAQARHRARPLDLDRPALAGVVLVEPLAPAIERPRPTVPMPAFFIDGVVADFTTPPPPVVCQHRPQDTSLPDPRLYRETPLACAYDTN